MDKSLAYVAVHESVHDIAANNALGFRELMDTVLLTLEEAGVDVAQLVDVQEQLSPGQELDDYWEEIAANTVPVILTDAETGRLFVDRILEAEEPARNVFERLLDAVQRFLRRAYAALKGQASWRQMEALEGNLEAIERLREAYFSALEELEGTEDSETGTTGNGTRYSTVTLPDGEQIVVIDEGQEAFDRAPRDQWAKIARKILKDRFAGQILDIGENDLARLKAKQAGEYAYPRNQKAVDSVEYAAKMRAAPELNHLLETAEYSHWSRDTKNHPEATLGFDYYNVRFIVGGHLFEGLVNIANSEKGRVFYDITKIREIPDTSGKYVALLARSSSTFGNSSTDSISESGENVNNLKFSMQDVSGADMDAVLGNQEAQDAAEALEAQFEAVKGLGLTQKTAEKMARQILANTGSRYDAQKLAQNLKAVFDYQTGEGAEFAQTVDAGTAAMKAVLEQSGQLDTQQAERYAELKKKLRETGISLSDSMKQSAAAQWGSYGKYRQALFGSVKITNDGAPLDGLWVELSRDYPELFDAEISEGDKAAALFDAVQATKPQYVNNFGYDLDAGAYDLFLQAAQAYFDTPEALAAAGKNPEADRLRAKMKEKIAQVRASSKARYEARLKKVRAEAIARRQALSAQYREAMARHDEAAANRLREQYRRLTDRRNEALLRQRAHYEQRLSDERARRRESDERRRVRTRVEKTAKTLMGWLTHPTDSKHVPESMRQTVADFLGTLDLGTPRNGAETRKAARWRDQAFITARFD